LPVSAAYRPRPEITRLGPTFYDAVSPARFPQHTLRFRNQRWATRVGLGDLDDAEWEAHMAAFAPLPDNLSRPLALRYHGHQFDVYNPDLGDGRGFLFAQLEDRESGRLLDLGTKGSGQTPWSRGGDGRLTLKGGVREVLATEMLEALGVDTSKSLSLFETGESLHRGDEPSPTRSSVLVRLSHSHVRFGTFQRLAHLSDVDGLAALLDYSVERYFPQIAAGPRRVVDFLEEVTRRSAALTASWMVAGFVHGVLNSDNMTITGESFDYGPYRFLPAYDVGFVAAYFDHGGLYAYGRQPAAVMRNLVRLGSALRPLAPHVDLAAALAGFEAALHDETTKRVLARLGLAPRSGQGQGAELVAAVFDFLESSDVGYDRFFFDLFGGEARVARARAGPAARCYVGPAWDELVRLLRAYEPAGPVPAYFEGEGPVTLVIDEIESLWAGIAERDDWSAFHEKVEKIREIPPLLRVSGRDAHT
jgi:uncharacterized protein YdiU (UPF0061 family)